MRRALLISPHFPPDSSAATHRLRLIAPHLAAWGWEPTVLTVEPRAYRHGLDSELVRSVPASLRVIRCPTVSDRLTRVVGIGDLGLRSLPAIYQAAGRLLRDESFDLLFITIFPSYTALIGPRLAKRYRVPFVLDYQDPWISAWGESVGSGPGGRPDLKSRMSRRVAEWLEPRVVRAASAITAVSEGTYEPILRRNPDIAPITEAIPIGAEPADFEFFRGASANEVFDPADGLAHVVYTGTLLPLGVETLRAVLTAVASLRDRNPPAFNRLRLHFVGTSNQSTPGAPERVMPLARELGVADRVQELPSRLPYSTVVRLQRQATALLAMGSSEPHYTASKIYPMLLAERPLVAAYHEASSVTTLLRSAARAPSVRLVTFDALRSVDTTVPLLAEALAAVVTDPVWRAGDIDRAALAPYLAASLAGRMAAVFDRAVARSAA
jgi:glycosyltransferase involved in cell wall biosynthesis